MIITISLTLLLFVFVKQGIEAEQILLPVVYILLYLVFLFLLAYLLLKEFVLYDDCCYLNYKVFDRQIRIPYELIGSAKYYPHVYRTGPVLIIKYRVRLGAPLKCARIELGQGSEELVAILKNCNVQVRTV